MADARVSQHGDEVTVFGSTASTRVSEHTDEVTVFGSTASTRVVQHGAEVAVFAIQGPARVLQHGAEVAVYGNPAEHVPGCEGEPSGVINHAGECAPSGSPISSTIEGYEPRIGIYTTPVCGPVSNLTAARTPAGRIILGWRTGSDFLVAVLEDVEDTFRDNVVSQAMRRIVVSYPGLRFGSIWIEGGDLFAAVAVNQIDGDYTLECWIADDPEDPQVWTFRGLIDHQADSGGGVFSIESMGPVTVTATGRYLLPTAAAISYGGSAPSDGSGLFKSDDRGATWVPLVQHRQSPLQSGTTGPIGNTLARNPLTGFIYWSHYWGPLGNQGRIYESQDDGASFVNIQNGSIIAWQFYADDNDSKLYAARANGSASWRAYEVIDPATNSFLDTGIDIINSRQGEQFQACRLGCYLAIIDTNRVARGWAPTTGWIIGTTQAGTPVVSGWQ